MSLLTLYGHNLSYIHNIHIHTCTSGCSCVGEFEGLGTTCTQRKMIHTYSTHVLLYHHGLNLSEQNATEMDLQACPNKTKLCTANS